MQELESLFEEEEEEAWAVETSPWTRSARTLRKVAILRAAPKLLIGVGCFALIAACATLRASGRGLFPKLWTAVAPQRLLGLQGYGQSRALPGVNSIRIFQWNPHYTCTQHRTCEQGSEDSLDDVLVRGRVDFANVIYLRDLEYRTPGMFKALVKSCDRDSVWLTYNSHLWAPEGNGQSGCLTQEDRAYVVQKFTHVFHSVSLIVVGVHYAHNSLSLEPLRRAIQLERQSTDVLEVIVMADFNRNREHHGQAILRELGVPHTAGVQTTENVRSCCQDDGFQQSFDHVIANFGSYMETQLIHDLVPSWARGRFHKGVLAQLTFGPGIGGLEMAPQGRPLGVPDTSTRYPEYRPMSDPMHYSPQWNGVPLSNTRHTWDGQNQDRRRPISDPMHYSPQRNGVPLSSRRQTWDGQNQDRRRDWEPHRGKNCFKGFGADSLPMERTSSLSECQSRCMAKGASCEGVVMSAAEQGSCQPVRSVRLSQCQTDVAFILWLKP